MDKEAGKDSGKSTAKVFLGKGKHTLSVVTTEVEWGVYTLVLEFDGSIEKHKFMIRG